MNVFCITHRLIVSVAKLTLLLVVSLAATQSYAQSLPELLDRTSEHLQGLANDTTDKSLELGDFDADGREDLLVVRLTAAPVLLINESGVLTNRTDQYLPAASTALNSNYAEAFDANNDGYTDLVLTRLQQSPLLYINRGQSDTGVWLGFDNPLEISAATNSLVIESGDINGDGFADLFIIEVELGANQLLMGDGSGQFTDESSRLGELGDLRRGHSALLADVESDGDIDIIYIESDLFLHVYHNDAGEFSNDLRLTFQNSDKFAYIFGAADFNGDGIFDYRVYSNTAPMAQMSAGFLDGSGMPFYLPRQDAPMQRGNRKHGTVHMRDVDGDGDTDYVLSSMLRNFGGLSNTFEGMRTEIVINAGFNSGEFFTFTGEDWGRGESMDMKFLDVNSDGNMDLFVAHQNRYGLYLNDAPTKQVELEGLTAQPQQAGQPATFSARLATGEDVQYQWDFGDGNVAISDQPTINHVYSRPGRYLVSLVANGSLGSDQITFTQRVHEGLLEGTARSSSGIVVEQRAAAERVWVVNPDNDSVTVLNADSGATVAEIEVCISPRSIALSGNGVALVSCKDSAEIIAISSDSFEQISRLSLQPGAMPHGVVVDVTRQVAYVVLQATGQLLKLSIPNSQQSQFQVLASLDTGSNPRHLALSADANTVFVSRFITRPVAGESTRNVATAGGGEMLVIDSNLMQLRSTVLLPYNDVEDANDRARGIPNYLTAPTIAPHGRTAVIGAKLDNIYRGSMRDGRARRHNVLVRSMAAIVDLEGGREVISDRIDFDNNSPPSAVAFGPSGNLLFVVHEGSRLLEIIDVYRGQTVYSTTLGFAPAGLALSADGRRLYVHNYLSREVSFIDTSQLIDGLSDNALLLRTVRTVSNEALSAQVLTGKRLFHDSANAGLSGQKYLSCAACHSEMGNDGRTWDFSDVGEGLRNTIDLRGRGGMAHGNLHWTANFDEIHDFENDIREVFNGAGLLSDEDFSRTSGILDQQNPKAGLSSDLDALAAFVSSNNRFPASPYRTASGQLTAAAVRGRQMFRRANCAGCHSGSQFTDSPRGLFHNIGTVDADTGNRLGLALPGNGLDTPTLRGLWLSAPYLHDGSAATLSDAVLAHRIMPRNVNVNQIRGRNMTDLVAYLMQIDEAEPVATSSQDNDGDLIPNDLDDDDDNDGVADTQDAFPYDQNETTDNDGDGIGDNSDADDDNDGIADDIEGANIDTDNDSVIDRFDLDSDNDTILDVVEAGGIDANGDGKIDLASQLISSPQDTDNDGLYNHIDTRSDSNDWDILASPYVGFDTNNDGVVNALDGSVDENGDGADDRIVRQSLVTVGSGCTLSATDRTIDPVSGLTLLLAVLGLMRYRTGLIRIITLKMCAACVRPFKLQCRRANNLKYTT